MTTNDPVIRRIRRVAGEAGYLTYDVEGDDAGGGPRHFTFSGNIFAGPVLMTSRDLCGNWQHEVIEDPRRFGEFFSAEWVAHFLHAWRREHLLDQCRPSHRSS